MKKKLRKMKAQGGTDQLEDKEDGDDRQGEDSMELEDSLEGVPEDTELSQDAPPSVGASPGTDGSITFPHAKLTTLPEVQAILKPQRAEVSGGDA